MADNKKIIPVVRKLLPKMLAEDIVGVQPMTQATGEIFTLKSVLTSGWSVWEKKFVFLPKRTINGKWAIGRVYMAYRKIYDKETTVAELAKTEFKWATGKDIFIEKLKNGS